MAGLTQNEKKRRAALMLESMASDALACLEESACEAIDLIDEMTVASEGRTVLAELLDRQIAAMKVNARTLDWLVYLDSPRFGALQ